MHGVIVGMRLSGRVSRLRRLAFGSGGGGQGARLDGGDRRRAGGGPLRSRPVPGPA